MKFHIYKDKKKEWRWKLVARNKNILADSGEGYKDYSTCKRAIFSIMRRAADCDIYNEEIKLFV